MKKNKVRAGRRTRNRVRVGDLPLAEFLKSKAFLDGLRAEFEYHYSKAAGATSA